MADCKPIVDVSSDCADFCNNPCITELTSNLTIDIKGQLVPDADPKPKITLDLYRVPTQADKVTIEYLNRVSDKIVCNYDVFLQATCENLIVDASKIDTATINLTSGNPDVCLPKNNIQGYLNSLFSTNFPSCLGTSKTIGAVPSKLTYSDDTKNYNIEFASITDLQTSCKNGSFCGNRYQKKCQIQFNHNQLCGVRKDKR